MKQSMGFVAGGTGIAPMLQIIEEILRNPADKTQLSLVYGSVSESDILLKARIDALAKKHASQFKVTYVLDKAPKGWTGASGFITSALLKEKLAPPSGDTMVIVCGPPGLMAAISGPKSPDFTQGDLGDGCTFKKCAPRAVKAVCPRSPADAAEWQPRAGAGGRQRTQLAAAAVQAAGPHPLPRMRRCAVNGCRCPPAVCGCAASRRLPGLRRRPFPDRQP